MVDEEVERMMEELAELRRRNAEHAAKLEKYEHGEIAAGEPNRDELKERTAELEGIIRMMRRAAVLMLAAANDSVRETPPQTR